MFMPLVWVDWVRSRLSTRPQMPQGLEAVNGFANSQMPGGVSD